MPRWLRILFVCLLVLIVLLTGVPVLIGGASMPCGQCLSTGVMATPSCVVVLASLLGLAMSAGACVVLRQRRERPVALMLSLALDRPPQFA